MNKIRLLAAKHKALMAELRIRQRNYNAAERDLNKTLRAINEVEKRREAILA